MNEEKQYWEKIDKIDSICKWHEYFFDICQVISKKSKDPSTKVGCVIVNTGNSIISTGYNGFPIGVKDNILDFTNDKITKSKRYNRPQKYLWTAHAEQNAIAFAARNGVSLKDSILYVNRMMPCARCTRLIIQSGIKNIFVLEDTEKDTIERWKQDNQIAYTMLEEANVKISIFKK